MKRGVETACSVFDWRSQDDTLLNSASFGAALAWCWNFSTQMAAARQRPGAERMGYGTKSRITGTSTDPSSRSWSRCSGYRRNRDRTRQGATG